ncbi:MAG: hypothetical protein ABL895_07430 [Cyclobacteriaceae bacterium]
MTRFIFISGILVVLSYLANGQGCSDAGFCTMGAMKPDQPFNKKVPIKLRSMEVSFYRGTTTLSPIIYVATVDMSFNIIDSKTFFQVKLPYQTADGNFGKTGSIGDISVCFTRNLYSSEKFDIGFSVGGKIRSNNSNLKNEDNGLSYPMYYQTSLGTYDIISGISLVNKKWLLATGIQHPFNQNENTFTWAGWIPVYQDGKGEDYVREYAPCYHLKRGTDVMLRVERNFRYARFNFTLGLLPIFRINKDEVTDPNTNQRIKLEGTTGMALSGIATLGYNFNVKSGVRLLLGKKFTQREVNPDGLTRHDVSTISYYYRF